MHAKIIIVVLFAVLIAGCTTPNLPKLPWDDIPDPGTPALSKQWDAENQTVIISTQSNKVLTIEKISLDPGLTTCEEVLNITSYVDYELNHLKDFRARWKQYKGRNNITHVDWHIQKNQSYNVLVPDYGIVEHSQIIPNITAYENVTDTWNCTYCTLGDCDSLQYWNISRSTANGTENGTVCFDRYEILQANPLKIKIYWNQTEYIGTCNDIRYKNVWKAFSPVGKTIHKNESYIIKVVYHKPAELGSVSIQTIPMFGGLDCEELTWWHSSWDYQVSSVIPNGARPYQYRLNISNSTDTNNATHVYGNGHFNSDYSDIRFTLDNITELSYGFVNDSVDPAIVWVNVTDNGTVNMYYGNSTVSTTSDLSEVVKGGVVTGFEDYLIHNFTSTSTIIIHGSFNVSALVIAGGGGGGGHVLNDKGGGGGGAGGLLYDAAHHVTSQTYSITVGSGGDGGSTINTAIGSRGQNGINTIFNTLESVGGGGGAGGFGSQGTDHKGYDGGSGGGATKGGAGGVATAGQGYDGGAASLTATDGGAGGGGAGAVGTYANAANGFAGGAGLEYDISGTSIFYAGGAGGGAYAGSGGSGGTGGGGDGGDANTDGIDGTDGLGGGGGGAGGGAYAARAGKTGGSGIVIIRYNNSGQWNTWSVETTLSLISSYSPSTPLQKSDGDSQKFEVNTSELTECRWYLNTSLIQTNDTDALIHNYTNTSLDEGYWNITAIVNTSTDNESQTWWVTVGAANAFGQDMYIDYWMYVTYLDSSNTILSDEFTELAPYYLVFLNSTDQTTYGYKSSRWETYADKIIQPGEAAMMRYTTNITKTRTNASGTFGLTLQTGLNHIGHSYNGTRNLTWYNTTIASSNLSTIEFQYPENGTLKLYTYGSGANGTVEVPQGFGVEVNVTAETVISGL